jgi:formyl transferase-like protein
MTSQPSWASDFIQRWRSRLRAQGIEIGCVVVDENLTRRAGLVSHMLSVAKRQSKVARCSLPIALVRLVVFRLWSNLGRPKEAVADDGLPEAVPSFRVPSLNSAEAVRAVRACSSDVSCLLGGRILTRSTIQELDHMILNGHASDPRFVRGRPPVFWEVLNEDRDICLTVHQAVEKLDAGPIYGQRLQEIIYCGGLGATIGATMKLARIRMTDLFAEVLIGIHAHTIKPIEFSPGPVRTVPRISELVRAEIFCRRRSKGIRPSLARDLSARGTSDA